MIWFTNIGDEEFTHTWDKKQFRIQSGETKPILFSADEEDNYNIGHVLARHLVGRYIEKEGITVKSKDDVKDLINKVLSRGEFSIQKENIEKPAEQKEEKPAGDEKTEVIAELEKKGAKVDKRKSADKLKEELKELDDETFEGLEE